MVRIEERKVGNVVVFSAWQETTFNHVYTETESFDDGKQYGRLGSENPMMDAGLSLTHLIRTQPELLDGYYQKGYDAFFEKYPQYKAMNDVDTIMGRVYVPVQYMQEEGRSQ